jgi:hypothetical protein
MKKDKQKMSKLELSGWVDSYESRWNVPSECPCCKGSLSKVDAIGLIGVMFVWCKDSKCRWCELYYE